MLRRCLLSLAVCLGWYAAGRAATPDLLLPENLATMGCAAPDARCVFVRGSQPGNVFHLGESVNLTVRLGGEPVTRLSVAVLEIGQRLNRYLKGMSVMTPPPAVELLGVRGKVDVPVGAGPEVELRALPVPQRYGTYVVTVAPNGAEPRFLCTLLRAMKPKPGFDPDAPVFGEGQFLTHDKQDPALLALRAQTLARLGIKAVRVELSPPMAQPGGKPYDWTRLDNLMNALADARVKALVTMGGHPYWCMPFGEPTPASIPEKPDFSCLPKYYPEFGQAIHDFCARYWKGGNGALWAIEHWNEPWEGISISGWESDSRHYRALFKLIWENAKRVDPRIQVAAACSSMNTEDKFLVGEDRAEWAKMLDLFTDHYVPARTCYGPMVAKHWGKQSTDTESWVAATEVLLPQVVCSWLACGQDRVTPWHPAMTYFAAPGAPQTFQMPNPVALASNVFNVMISGRPFRRVLFLDHVPWGFQFGDGADATVVYFGQLMPIWGDSAEAIRDTLWWQLHLNKGGRVTIDNRDQAIEFYDLAGNRELQGVAQVSLPCDYLAHYLRSPKGGVKLIAERLRAARLDGVRPVEILARDFTSPLDAPGAVLRVTLHNLLNRPLHGALTARPPAGVTLKTNRVVFALKPGARVDLDLPVAAATPVATNAYLFSFDVASDGGAASWTETLHAVVAKRGTKTIDGDLTDWAADLPVLVDAKLQKVDPTQRAWMPFVDAQDRAPDGTFGELKLAWDDRYLYVAARINDPKGGTRHQRLATWDEDQYFRGAADDAVCESLRPFEKFVSVDPNKKDAVEKLKADPQWSTYQQFLKDHPEGQAAVTTNAARVWLAARKRNPTASFADASHVYKRPPWGDKPWAGETLQLAFDVLPDYAYNLKLDHDRVPWGFHAMPDTDYEYSAYLCTDGKPEVWRLLAPGVPRGHHDPRQPRAKRDQGAVEAPAAVRRAGNLTTYELAIPWRELSEWKPRAGQTFGFTWRANDAKGAALSFGADKSVTKTNGLTLHPYWEAKPSCGVRWALAP